MSRTALDLDIDEWGAYDPAGKSRQLDAKERKLFSRRQRQAMQVARQAANLLKGEFQASRVAVFGSLAQEDSFTPWSDIDLAAWGIPPEKFYAAVAAVTGLSGDFKVDLIDPDTCSPALRRMIETQSRVLYWTGCGCWRNGFGQISMTWSRLWIALL